ncbi:helix-turn-helix domain-containing protein [Nocardioides mangrovicus]|nr:helix-turn-helix transcriptional regulator [Nocardioides mangrovicus]
MRKPPEHRSVYFSHPPISLGSERPRTVNIRQVVAWNVRRARKQRGWNQGELAQRLQEQTGRTWTNAAVSAAEGTWSADAPRPRAFDAEELLSFALALRVPLPWFFLPPDPTAPGTARNPNDVQVTLGRADPGHASAAIGGDQLYWIATALGATDQVWDDRLASLEDGAGRVAKAVAALSGEDVEKLIELLVKIKAIADHAEDQA